MNLKTGLYIVSTPIGNLSDITFRAIEVLKNSDYILCEDTRISSKLLLKYNLSTPLSIYNDRSGPNKRLKIKSLIDSGKVISLVSDAGTPLISDPGYKLINELISENYHVDVIPGVCSPVAALTLSALPTDRFFFAGFLPKTDQKRIKIFTELVDIKATLIFFETSHRIESSLKIALEVFGDRKCSLARELTKLYQTMYRHNISDMLRELDFTTVRGEMILMISGIKNSITKN